MDLSSLVVWFLVLLLLVGGVFGAWNRTSIALIASWLIGVTWEETLGEGIPLQGDIIRDLMVLVVIFTKMHKDCEHSPGRWGWLRDCWPHASRCDKTVALLFVPMWITYAINMDQDLVYAIRWSAGVLQFLFAGAEAVEMWRRGRARPETDSPTSPSMSRSGLAANEC